MGKLSDARKKGLLADYRDAESGRWHMPLLIFPGVTHPSLPTSLANTDMVGDPRTLPAAGVGFYLLCPSEQTLLCKPQGLPEQNSCVPNKHPRSSGAVHTPEPGLGDACPTPTVTQT